MSLNQETIYVTFSAILTLKAKTIRVSIIHYMGAQRFQGFLVVIAASLGVPKIQWHTYKKTPSTGMNVGSKFIGTSIYMDNTNSLPR